MQSILFTNSIKFGNIRLLNYEPNDLSRLNACNIKWHFIANHDGERRFEYVS